MALKKFRSGALKNKYGFPLLQGGKTYFICFSGAEKFFSHFFSSLSRRDPFGRFFLWFFPLYQDKGKNALQNMIYNRSLEKSILMTVVHFLLSRKGIPSGLAQEKRAPRENGSDNCHCRKRPVPQHGKRF